MVNRLKRQQSIVVNTTDPQSRARVKRAERAYEKKATRLMYFVKRDLREQICPTTRRFLTRALLFLIPRLNGP